MDYVLSNCPLMDHVTIAAPKSPGRAKPLTIYERDKYETSLIGGDVVVH